MFFVNKQKLVEDFFETNIQIGKFLHQLSNISMEDKVTTMLQMHALTYLKKHPGETVGELAQSFQMSSSSAAQFMERLEKADLVERIQDKKDKRIIRLSITKNGEREFIILKKKFMDKMQKIFSKIPANDIREIIRIQTNLIETLKKQQ